MGSLAGHAGGFHVWGGRESRELALHGKRVRYVRITGRQDGMESKWFSLWEVTARAGCRDYYPYYGCFDTGALPKKALQGKLTYERCASKAVAAGNLAFGLLCPPSLNNSHGTCNIAERRLYDIGDLKKGGVDNSQCASARDQAGRHVGGILKQQGSSSSGSSKSRVAVYTMSGLKASFYDFKQNAHLPNLKGKKPTFVRIEDTVDDVYDKGVWGKRMNRDPALADHMAAQWTGKIAIPKDGEYKFWLKSDDGSKLWIDGNPIVDNDGLHGLRVRTGTRKLTKGQHAFKVEFFEYDQGKGIQAMWQIPGGKKEIIPAGVFVP